MTIGEKIKNARNLRGLTQKELGIKLGFDEKSFFGEYGNFHSSAFLSVTGIEKTSHQQFLNNLCSR